jgi:two-component system, OmpR family, sensor histidine kinase SenX3
VSRAWPGRRRNESGVDAAKLTADLAASSALWQRAQEVFAALPVGVVLFDEHGGETFRNPAMAQVGVRHVAVLVDEAVQRALGQLRSGADPDDTVEFFGPPRVVVRVCAFHLAGDHAAVTVEDVSERVRADVVRTDLVANISHELKTPVGALALLAETIADVDDPELIQRLSSRIVDEAHRMARTIDELVELSRVELSGEQAEEPVDMSAVMSDMLQRTQLLAERHRVTVDVDMSGDATVVGSHIQLVSAVSNLVENAIAYSDPGGVVKVDLAVDGGEVQVRVVDRGPGIPSGEQERIFERFYRVDRARSRASGGTGIGLSIVRNVAVHHGGTVSVVSHEGEGATFTLTLPIRHVVVNRRAR